MITMQTAHANQVRDEKFSLVPADRLETQISYTKEDYDAASDFYRATVDNKSVGRPPMRDMFAAWIAAGRPETNLDEKRMEMLAVEELSGKAFEELGEDEYQEWIDVWNEQGNPEPLKFIPAGAVVKFVGEKDGETVNRYVEDDALRSYKEKHNLQRSSNDVYLAVLSKEEKEGVKFHTLVFSTGYTRPTDENGKPITKSAALERDAKRLAEQQEKIQNAIAEAYAQRDWSKLEGLGLIPASEES